jgi:hypothetical protein
MRKAAGGQESRRESVQLAAMGGHFSVLMNFVGVAVARRSAPARMVAPTVLKTVLKVKRSMFS